MDNQMMPPPPEEDGLLADVPEESVSPEKLEDALRAITQAWQSKLSQARKHKRPFQTDADECMRFFDGQGDWFWRTGKESTNGKYSKICPPSFRMVINRCFEAVKLFGSVIYHRNPVRTV